MHCLYMLLHKVFLSLFINARQHQEDIVVIWLLSNSSFTNSIAFSLGVQSARRN